MDVERALVCKIVSTGQLEDAISKGVRSDLFWDDECRDVFDYIVDHARKYKSTPSTAALKSDKEDFDFLLVQEPLEYLIDKFSKAAKKRLAQEMVVELAKITDDPQYSDEVDLRFLEASRKLATLVPMTEVHRFVGDMEKRQKEYDQDKKDLSDGKRVLMKYGFPTLDRVTGGMASHEFITMSGFSGLGKSTFLKVVAFNVWAQGFTPLFITLEEEAKLIAQKFDAMAASLNFTRLKHLDLSDEEYENWRGLRERLRNSTAEIPIIDKIRHCTPEHVFAETVRYKPDLVLVDYISLMRSSRPGQKGGMSMWQSISEITQDLKQNARTLGVPILAAAQTNRSGSKDGAELDNIGNSISIVQDSDVVLGLFSDEEMRERNLMEIRVNKNRRGPLTKFQAKWDHDGVNFHEKDAHDMFKREDDETAEEFTKRLVHENEAPKGGKRKRPGGDLPYT
jgi:replicative DNA helicase